MDPFMLKTLKKLKKEAPRRLKQLITVCDKLIGMQMTVHIGFIIHFKYYY
jgi:hypothetical protein